MAKVSSTLAAVFLLLAAAIFIFSGCTPTTSGAVKDDSSLTGVSEGLAPTGDYTGPKLRVGVVNFQNKTPSKNIGVGERNASNVRTGLRSFGSNRPREIRPTTILVASGRKSLATGSAGIVISISITISN